MFVCDFVFSLVHQPAMRFLLATWEGGGVVPPEMGDPIRSTANVICVTTAPHGQIIPEAALAITHYGHGTTLKTLAAGVAMVCMPMGRDQNDTAARLVKCGAGVRLKPAASPSAIRHGVEQVLDDLRFRAAAGRMRHEVAVEVGANDVAADIERATSQPAGELLAV